MGIEMDKFQTLFYVYGYVVAFYSYTVNGMAIIEVTITVPFTNVFLCIHGYCGVFFFVIFFKIYLLYIFVLYFIILPLY